MAFPQPGEYALGATASTTLLTYQPIRQVVIRSPRLARRDNGVVQQGGDQVRLYWTEGDGIISNAEYQYLMGWYNTAKGQAGRIFLKYWDAEASSGAGAYQTKRCLMEPPDGDLIGAEGVYTNVSILFRAVGIPA